MGHDWELHKYGSESCWECSKCYALSTSRERPDDQTKAGVVVRESDGSTRLIEGMCEDLVVYLVMDS